MDHCGPESRRVLRHTRKKELPPSNRGSQLKRRLRKPGWITALEDWIWTPLEVTVGQISAGKNWTVDYWGFWLVLSRVTGGSAGALDPPRLSPATKPEVIVAMRGVFVFGLIWAKALKSTPSSAIAKITRGIGKMEPSRLNETAETCETKN